MNLFKRLVLVLVCVVCFLTIPFFYDSLMLMAVSGLNLGWMTCSILLRLAVIILFGVALKQIFALFLRTKSIKTWVVIILAVPAGFGISFIAPIYNTDYGMFNDELKLNLVPEMQKMLAENFRADTNHKLVGFFTMGCGHCEITLERIAANQAGGQKIPVLAVFSADEGDPVPFLEAHHADNLSYYQLQSDSLFGALSGGIFPSVFLLNKSDQTTYHWTGELNYTALDYLKSLPN